jgi:hypothetical protein
MATERQLLELISELTRKTISGDLKWTRKKSLPVELQEGTNDRIPYYFETNFGDSRVGIATRRFQNYSSDMDSFIWNERPMLVFLNDDGQVSWEYEDPSSGLWSLMDTVKESTTNVAGLLKNLSSITRSGSDE